MCPTTQTSLSQGTHITHQSPPSTFLTGFALISRVTSSLTGGGSGPLPLASYVPAVGLSVAYLCRVLNMVTQRCVDMPFNWQRPAAATAPLLRGLAHSNRITVLACVHCQGEPLSSRRSIRLSHLLYYRNTCQQNCSSFVPSVLYVTASKGCYNVHCLLLIL